MKTVKNQRWVTGQDIDLEPCGPGVTRRILSYTDDLMCVENHFSVGAVGALHCHKHTQITYVVSGAFRFTIGTETRVVHAGDSLLKTDSVLHGCECLQEGILLDIFSPMREDFVQPKPQDSAK